MAAGIRIKSLQTAAAAAAAGCIQGRKGPESVSHAVSHAKVPDGRRRQRRERHEMKGNETRGRADALPTESLRPADADGAAGRPTLITV